MEDVLEVYQRPHDPECPLVCLDETSKQLIAETRVPIPAKPGHPARHDYEYERNGTANLFMMFAPLEGWRHVEVTDRHTAVDYAHVLKDLSDTHFPKAKKIVLVQDNLNTHKPASLYEAFPAPEARRLVEKFEWHYTPKHGSWLDMAESELSVLSGQCLDRRIPNKLTLAEEVAAWEDSRNKKHVKADWHFTTADARVKPKRLYPAIRTTRGTSPSYSAHSSDSQNAIVQRIESTHRSGVTTAPSTRSPRVSLCPHRLAPRPPRRSAFPLLSARRWWRGSTAVASPPTEACCCSVRWSDNSVSPIGWHR
jgi:DDE superfamily endonuclease